MSARRLIRLGLTIGVVVVLWMRTAQSGWDRAWMTGSAVLTVLLAAAIAVEISQARKGYRRPADEVPKRPLGL
ncbi:MAG: hypothetical protein JO022_15495 [Acidobacteriaceae bacterium]|nr:hypothetical protein [Acidobacteriaceae bacterium]